MNRRNFLLRPGLYAGFGLTAASVLSGARPIRSALAETLRETPWKTPRPWAAKLIAAAESQIGVTLIYDPAYAGLAFPNGDVPRERGVCTDVIVRAYRDAFGFDLQQAVNADMKAHFSRYPKIWGLKGPDRNIDHRRVPNLQTFFERRDAALPVSTRAGDYVPGDIVSQMLPGNLPHIAIVTHRRSADGERPMLVHNIGGGTRLEDRLFEFKITGRYRFRPA